MTLSNFNSLAPTTHRPSHQRFCVIIPAYNEALLVRRCIESVITAGVPAHDIYVVDDVSTDGTGTLVAGVAGINLLVNVEKRGKLGGIEDALRQFRLVERYDFVAILDADSHVGPTYFDEVLVRFLQDEETVLVCGAPQSERYNWVTAYRAFEYAVTLRLYREGQHALGVITVAPGCASVYRTRVLGQLQWDGGTLVEDMDLTVQIHRKSLGRVAYTRHAVAFTQDPRSVRDYMGQLTRWYRGTWQVMRLHRVPFGKQRIDAEFALLLSEGLFFAVATLCLPLLVFFWPTLVLRCIVADQVMAVSLAVACAVKLKRADLVAYVWLFPILRLVNCIVLLRTFWSEIIRRQPAPAWFSVGRYAGAYEASSK